MSIGTTPGIYGWSLTPWVLGEGDGLPLPFLRLLYQMTPNMISTTTPAPTTTPPTTPIHNQRPSCNPSVIESAPGEIRMNQTYYR